MSEQNQEPQVPENEEQKKDKITKQHAEAIAFVTALVGGHQQLLPQKSLGVEGTANVVALLFQEERKEFEKKALTELKELLKKYFEFTKEMSKCKKELEQKEQQKKKEFTEAVNNLKRTITQQDVMNEGYAAALTEATEKLAENE